MPAGLGDCLSVWDPTRARPRFKPSPRAKALILSQGGVLDFAKKNFEVQSPQSLFLVASMWLYKPLCQLVGPLGRN